MIVTRFAPSPNGSLHLGHALSAIVGHDLAQDAGGRFLLRIEDIDGARSRPELARDFETDLRWLGLAFERVPNQSARLREYEKAAATLRDAGLLYPCVCTRAEIDAARPALSPEGPIYPGICKGRAVDPARPTAWRLDVDLALSATGPLTWFDERHGQQLVDAGSLAAFGDVVLVRKDAPSSYHLAATLDDAADGVTLVTRGMDLFGASNVHRLLQELLGLNVPRWHHHGLLVDAEGRKLAKRRGSTSLTQMRAAGANGREIVRSIRLGAFPAGISLANT